MSAAAWAMSLAGCALGSHEAAASSTQRDNYAYIAEAIGPSLPVYAKPGGKLLSTFSNPNEWHDPLVMLATARSGNWFQVRVPVRPNGSTGWVPASSVRLTWDPYRIVVDISKHQLVLLDVGRPVLHTPVAVGAKATPTPHGTFYLTALLQPPDPNGAYGPYAFGLSGYSPVLKSFAGGDGEIGLHGTNDPGSIGHSVTHGCIRVANKVMLSIAGRLPLGTPVIVKA